MVQVFKTHPWLVSVTDGVLFYFRNDKGGQAECGNPSAASFFFVYLFILFWRVLVSRRLVYKYTFYIGALVDTRDVR